VYAYLPLQVVSPLTLAPALADSPVGFLAWLLDKFQGWSDGEAGLAVDDVLTEATTYLASDSVASSFVAYSDLLTGASTLPPGRRIEVPSAYAAYPDPRLVAPPADFVRRSRHLVRYSTPPRGGHFPALEVPDLFVEDLRSFLALV
jgi:pimeloyl-ACP methyl ester carboxylesterase